MIKRGTKVKIIKDKLNKFEHPVDVYNLIINNIDKVHKINSFYPEIRLADVYINGMVIWFNYAELEVIE